MITPTALERAHKFLAGERLTYEQANGLWRQLNKESRLSLARQVLERMRLHANRALDLASSDDAGMLERCRKEAMCTSKDQELPAGSRHDLALLLLKPLELD